MNTTEVFLLAMLLIFTVPYLVWRLGRTDYVAPLVIVQIIGGVLLGPGVLGAAFPEYHQFVFTPAVMQSLNGVAWWAVMLFVMIAGIELDLKKVWQYRRESAAAYRRESAAAAGFALGVPLLFGCAAALLLLAYPGWIGPKGKNWQFLLGIGSAVTAHANLDDVAIWGVLAIILLDWERVGRQAGFLLAFGALTVLFRRLMVRLAEGDRQPDQRHIPAVALRRLMVRLAEGDRWYVSLIWLAACGFGADWAGLHYMVGAFLAGVVMDAHWFEQRRMDLLFKHVLLVMMPVFFLSTGLRTQWDIGSYPVFFAAGLMLLASVGGKLLGARLAGRMLGWKRGEASIIGWLLQTKGLIEIIFANILLDKQIISSETFTALLLMACASTMLTVPVVHPRLHRAGNAGLTQQASSQGIR
eukprot:gene21893-24826_t